MRFTGSYPLACLFLAALHSLSALVLIAQDTKPNIIWIFTDDHAVQALSAYGGRLKDVAPTPGIDRLADEGMLFQKSYVANSICGPSRACVLTGQHSHKNGVLSNEDEEQHIDYDQVITFPQILQKNGYTTAIFGKWHLGSQPQGFDQWAVLPGQGRYFGVEFREPANNEKGERYVGYKDEHSTTVIMNKTLDFLESQKGADKPFMLMCQFKAPHRAWNPDVHLVDYFEDTVFPEPETLHDDYATRGVAAHEQEMTILKDMKMKKDLKLDGDAEKQRPGYSSDPRVLSFYDRREADYEAKKPTGAALLEWKYQAYMQDYLATVKGVDEQVQRLLDYLDANGLTENTIVAYSSDQGFYLGEHGWFDKRFMYEESFRTPLLVRWPGKIKPGSVNADLVQNIDIAPTFLEIAGAAVPEVVQGKSLLPIFEGHKPADWRESLYYHFYEYSKWHRVRKHEGVSDGRHKLIRFYGPDVPNGEEFEYYDLESDPNELNNRYNSPEAAAQVDTLKAELQRLREQYEVPDES